VQPSPAELYDAIAAQIRVCTRCRLCEGRTNAVPGEGPLGAKVAFVGEGPGADEDAQGRPFVGKSGQLLRDAIRAVGMVEDEVFIANVVKCRPPGNRDPLPEEITACRSYLLAQLALVQPRVIVTLGRYSMDLLIKPGLTITRVRGQHMVRNGQLIMPTYHPSYVLRNRNNDIERDFRRDIAVARKLAEQPVGATA
jgi:uracil-DNA glycosylase family 4